MLARSQPSAAPTRAGAPTPASGRPQGRRRALDLDLNAPLTTMAEGRHSGSSKVSRCKSETISGHTRSNGYVHQQDRNLRFHDHYAPEQDQAPPPHQAPQLPVARLCAPAHRQPSPLPGNLKVADFCLARSSRRCLDLTARPAPGPPSHPVPRDGSVMPRKTWTVIGPTHS